MNEEYLKKKVVIGQKREGVEEEWRKRIKTIKRWFHVVKGDVESPSSCRECCMLTTSCN